MLKYTQPQPFGGAFEKFSAISLLGVLQLNLFSATKPVSVFGFLHIRQRRLVWQHLHSTVFQ